MNKNTTSNIDLLNILKKENITINGVFPKDKLEHPLKDGFYIINLNDSDEAGSHWTVLYKLNDAYSLYFDAFGFKPPEIIEDLLYKYGYTKQQIQDINSTSCGFYCIAFIKFMYNKRDYVKSYRAFCSLFSEDTIRNEIILNHLLYG
jgi:hypothetical protein